MTEEYKAKYLKYKSKYLELKGGIRYGDKIYFDKRCNLSSYEKQPLTSKDYDFYELENDVKEEPISLWKKKNSTNENAVIVDECIHNKELVDLSYYGKNFGTNKWDTISKNNYIRKVVVEDDAQIAVLGDIHSGLKALHKIIYHELGKKGFFKDLSKSFVLNEKKYIVFTGDFVDRGAFGLEVLLYVITLYNENPNKVILTAGNHETSETFFMYGLKNEIDNQLNDKKEIFKELNIPFKWEEKINSLNYDHIFTNYYDVKTMFFGKDDTYVRHQLITSIMNLLKDKNMYRESAIFFKDSIHAYNEKYDPETNLESLFDNFMKLLPCASIVTYQKKKILFNHGGIPSNWNGETEDLNKDMVNEFLWNDYSVDETKKHEFNYIRKIGEIIYYPWCKENLLNKNNIFFTISGHQDYENFNIALTKDEFDKNKDNFSLVRSKVYNDLYGTSKNEMSLQTGNTFKVFITSTAHPVRSDFMKKYCYLLLSPSEEENKDERPIILTQIKIDP